LDRISGLELNTYRAILDNVSASVFVSDMESFEILYMNKTMIDNFGGDKTGELCYRVFRDETEICSNCPISYLIDDDGNPTDPLIWEGKNNLTGHWYQNQDQVIRWEDGRLVKLQIAVDIEDAKQALLALELSEECYRSLFDSSQTAMVTLSAPGWGIVSGNPAALDLFGFKNEKDIQSSSLWQLSGEHQPNGNTSHPELLKWIRAAEENGSAFFPWTFTKATGQGFPATVQLTRIKLVGDQILQAAITDVSDLRQAERLLRQQMDDLGLINALNVAANRSGDLSTIFRLLARDTKRNFNSRNAAVYLLSEDQDSLLVEAQMLDTTLIREFEEKLGFSVPQQLELALKDIPVFQEILNSGKPKILDTPEDIQTFIRDMFSASTLTDIIKVGASLIMPQAYRMSGVRSMMVIPLMTAGNFIGMMDITSSEYFTAADLNRAAALAEQVSGIIQRVRAERDRAESISELELISRALNYSGKIENINEICQHLADQVSQAHPDSIVMVSVYDPGGDEIRLRAIQGFGLLEDRITKLLGEEPKAYKINRTQINIDDTLIGLLRSGKLERIPGGLSNLTNYFFSRRISNALVKLMGIDDLYLIGFNANGDRLGSLMIGLKKGQRIRFPSALETIAHHFGEIFESRITQEEVRQRTAQLEALRAVELDITSTLNLENLLFSIAEKAAQIVDAASSGFSVYNPDTNMLDFLGYTGQLDLPKVTALRVGEGLSGQVWEEQRTITIDNYAEWEGRSSSWAEIGNYFLAGIPVCWGEERLGVLEIALEPGRRLSPGDIELLEMFATQAAIAIKNAQLYQAEKRKRQETETLRELGMLINSNLEREELLDLILVSLQKVVPYHNASIQIVRGDYCVVEAFRGAEKTQGVIGKKFKITENALAHPVLYEGRNIIIDDVQGINDWILGEETGGIRSWIAVPLQVGGERFGILTLDHTNTAQYGKQDADLALDFANQAAIALENKRLLEEAKQRLYRIESLRQVDLVISGSVDLDISMNVLVRQLMNSLDVDAATVLIFNKEQNTFDYISGHGFLSASLQHTSLRMGEGLAGKAAQDKKMVRIQDLAAEETSLQRIPFLEKEKFRSYLAVPLIAKGDVVGVLEVFHRSMIDPDEEWIGFLKALAGQAAIAIDRLNLFNGLEGSNLDLTRAYDATIEGWAKAIELRDSETEGHSRRVVKLTLQLAMRMGVSGELLLNIRRGSLLHDIGKMAIPDLILMKPSALSDQEWVVMREHPAHAFQMLSPIGYLLGALDIPYCHHERWDGTGYPRGLKEEDIPLAARIFAVVDVWDALQSDRPYRPAWSEQQALQYIRENSGSHFDPQVAAEFIQMIESGLGT
jgi:PAS domain S-box-containing protein